ncbi:ULK/ULK protein kinase [Puccinia sorghi]|uniref:non-specific serine/threonine protein kinase n=1 Tax=Puccinia sorghi TaxID=27349 RepID=A0A0L6V436_9BASI|nr:ULK/ULK protein kinase [Puccinia sorghi]
MYQKVSRSSESPILASPECLLLTLAWLKLSAAPRNLYMAPEILRYEKYDAKADLWSVGAVLFEMAVGKPPFRAQNHVELLRNIEKSEDKIAFPTEKVVAQDLKRLILCLLKRNPAERVSFEEFFLMADQVSRVGPLIAPTSQYQQSSSIPHTSNPLRPQLTTFHTTSVQAHQKTLSPRPPSISTLPSPAAPKGKSQQLVPSNPFHGEPGAFIIEEKSPSHRPKNTLQPHSGPHKNQTGTTDRTPQNRQISLPSALPSHTHPGFQAPSPSILPTPQPSSAHRQSSWMPSFPAKYIVPGPTVPGSSNSKHSPSVVVSTAVKSKDYAVIRSPSLTSPIKQNSNPQVGLPFQGEEDEDRDLGTEYVVVEKGSVEINAMVDGLSSSSPSQKPMSLGRRMSRGFMAAKPTLAALSSSPHRTNPSASPPHPSLVTTTHAHPPPQHSSPVSSFPPRPNPAAPSPIPTGTHPMNIANFGRSSPSNQGHVYGAYPSSPRSFDSGGGGIGSLPIVGKYFPQSHHHYNHSSATPIAPGGTNSSAGPAPQAHHRPPYSFPSSTICRAILSADPLQASQTTSSKSTGYGGTMALAQQPHRPLRSPPSRPQHLDAVESQLLAELEEFACKALVIVQFADDKLNAILPPPPSALGPTNTGTSSGSTSTFSGTIGAFITCSHQHPSVSEPLDTSSPVDPHQARLMSDLASGSTVLTASNKALLAGEALVLYIKALAFLNKAIRHGVAVVDWKKLSFESAGGTSTRTHGFSSETRCAIEWLRNKFNEVFDKAEFVKTNINGKSLLQAGSISADKLIYDRALEKSRTAAVNELVGDRLGECELEYEGSLWMLYGLLDESIMRTDTMFDVLRPEAACSSSSSFSSSCQQQQARGPRTRVESEGLERPTNDELLAHTDLPPSPAHDAFIRRSCPKIIDSILLRLLALKSSSTIPSTPPSLPNTLPTPASSRSFDDSIDAAFK